MSGRLRLQTVLRRCSLYLTFSSLPLSRISDSNSLSLLSTPSLSYLQLSLSPLNSLSYLIGSSSLRSLVSQIRGKLLSEKFYPPLSHLHLLSWCWGCYGKQDADILIPKIDCAFRELFKEYSELEDDNALEATSRSSSSSSISTPMSCDPLQVDTGIDFANFISSQFEMDMGCAGSGDKSELERYLEHALEPRESHFNVLHWWKTNQKRYPTLALIARDLLAIPVSTVASECAFSTGGRVLDSFRTSLTPRMVESLICTQDWLRTSRTPLVLEENILQLEELEEGMFDLLKEQPSIIIDETLDPSDLFDMDFED